MTPKIEPKIQLLWHPSQSLPRFSLANLEKGYISVYEWDALRHEIRNSSQVGNLGFMRCVDWSPDTGLPDLHAVGGASGKIDLVRPGIDSGPSAVNLTPRVSRACTCLSFCGASTNLLAAGFERARSEPGLKVYDLETLISVFNAPPIIADEPLSSGRGTPVTSSITNASMVTYLASGEFITSTSFLPDSHNLLLSAVSHKWLRIYDLRSSASSNSVAQSINARMMDKFSIDPLESTRFASSGDDTVYIWDLRNLSHPNLTFSNHDAIGDGGMPSKVNSRLSFEFSSSIRGLLACMEVNSSLIRFWNIVETPSIQESLEMTMDHRSTSSLSAPTPSSSKSKLFWINSSHTLMSSLRSGNPSPLRNEGPVSSYVLSDTRAIDFSNRLDSFVFVPSEQSGTSIPTVLASSDAGDLEMISVPDPVNSVSSRRGWICLSKGADIRLFGATSGEVNEDSLRPLTGKYKLRINETAQHLMGAENARYGYLSGIETSAPVSTSTPLFFQRVFHARSQGDPKLTSESDTKAIRRGDAKTGSRVSSEINMVFRIMKEDIGETMRERAARGYSRNDFLGNAQICRESTLAGKSLSDVWRWVYHCDALSGHSSHILGYDFRFQGAQGLWEGLPMHAPIQAQFLHSPISSPRTSLPGSLDSTDTSLSSTRSLSSRPFLTISPVDPLHGSYSAALSALVPPNSFNHGSRIKVTTGKVQHRMALLQLCGILSDEDDIDAIRRWQKEGKRTKAACWAVFCDQVALAIQILANSTDDQDKLASGILILLHGSERGLLTRSPQVKEHYTMLIPKLDDRYLRAMLYHAALEDWSEVLAEDLPLPEKLTVAFRYLPDEAVTRYLRSISECCRQAGDLLGLMVTGLTPIGMQIIQSYVDLTGDVQSASLFSGLVCPSKFCHPAATLWLDSYRQLLIGWGLIASRSVLDISHHRNRAENMPVPGTPSLSLHCNYCGKSSSSIRRNHSQTSRSVCCMHCSRSLPRCAVCLVPIEATSIPVPSNTSAFFSNDPGFGTSLFCQTCRHGGHADHILAWFYGGGDGLTFPQSSCPVAGCTCNCFNEFQE